MSKTSPEKRSAPNIDITPEMIEAGGEILRRNWVSLVEPWEGEFERVAGEIIREAVRVHQLTTRQR